MSADERKRLATTFRELATGHVGDWPNDLRRAADLLDPPAPPEGTVRIRVACVARQDGVWSAFGHSQSSEPETINNAQGGVWVDGETDQSDRLTWGIFDIPLPAPPAEVEGRTE